ncbi:34134_t:CDS:1, partial [Gigaspora margarita]
VQILMTITGSYDFCRNRNRIAAESTGMIRLHLYDDGPILASHQSSKPVSKLEISNSNCV